MTIVERNHLSSQRKTQAYRPIDFRLRRFCATRAIFPGTGVSIITRKRRSPGLLIETEEAHRVLFDCGPGTAQTLEGMGYSISRLDYIFLTHLHVDHALDYATIVNDRAFTTRGSLHVYGPKGLERHTKILFNELFPDLGSTFRCFDYLSAKEVDEGLVADENGWKVSCAPVKHAGGVCYRMDSFGKSLLYSGDTGPCQSLTELGREVDLAVMECSFPDPTSLKDEHLYPTLAGSLAAKMKAKKLILTHLYPECDGREEEMLIEAKRRFTGQVLIAEDGMRIRI